MTPSGGALACGAVYLRFCTRAELVASLFDHIWPATTRGCWPWTAPCGKFGGATRTRRYTAGGWSARS
jgi:hypothetical protein